MITRFRLRLNVLGWLGLGCLVLVGWAVERLDRKTRWDTLFARLVLAVVTIIGWMVDRLPPSALDTCHRPSVPRNYPLSTPH